MASEPTLDRQTIDLPWGAWYGDGVHVLPLPRHWQVDRLCPLDLPPCSASQIAASIDDPVNSPPLADLAAGKRSACLVIDDLARPTKTADILPHLIKRVELAGIPPDAISIVVATGTHGSLSPDQLGWKLGLRVASRHPVESHNANGDLAATGIHLGQIELRLNRTFLNSELKIAVGSVLPHPFAGFSGGAKLILPGLADIEATARTHKFVQMGLRGGSNPNDNRFRLEAEDVCRQLGVAFVVCVISNAQRDVARVVAGDLVAAHRLACEHAAEAATTNIVKIYDCLICNAYPKDINLIQSEGALISLKTAASPVITENGVLLLTTAASEGMGRHGLFQPGGHSYMPPRLKRQLGGRELWLYAPSVNTAEVHQLYWEQYPVFHDGETLLRALTQRFPGRATAGVLPCAPMQQLQAVQNVDKATL